MTDHVHRWTKVDLEPGSIRGWRWQVMYVCEDPDCEEALSTVEEAV